MSNLIKRIPWYVFGAVSFAARMLVVALGCGVLTVWVTGWLQFSWQFWVVFALVFLAYIVASAVEYLADYTVKRIKSEGLDHG